MVKVKLTISRVTAKESQKRGSVVSVDADEAERLITAGKAMPVSKKKVERTVKSSSKIETR